MIGEGLPQPATLPLFGISLTRVAWNVLSRTEHSTSMPRRRLPNYLRTYRKRFRLSQRDVAYLLGCRSGAKVSRYEHFRRQPNVKTVFAYQALFRAPAQELFAGYFQDVEDAILCRARELALKLSKAKPDRANARKLQSLHTLFPSLKDQSAIT